MTTTHGHRKYTMSDAARQQRRMARQARANNPRRQKAGRIIGLHITTQAAAIVLSYPQGRARRDFLSSTIRQHYLRLGVPPPLQGSAEYDTICTVNARRARRDNNKQQKETKQ